MSGLHLPAFAAAEGGLFAEHGIEVEFVDLLHASDQSLEGFATRPLAVAAGRADFALTSVAYLMAAQTMTSGRLPVRFAAISHQRNPICGIVLPDSDLFEAQDLAGRPAGIWSMPWFTQEYAGALAHMGLEAPKLVEFTDEYLDGALRRGEIDVIPTWMDMTLHYRSKPEFPFRVIPLDIDVYTSGLVAADRLAPEIVEGVRDAFVAGYALQLERPELGIAAFRRRYPDVSEKHIRANWSLFEPYAFDRVPPGSMDAGRWDATIDYMAATHELPVFPGERLYRPELLTPPRKPSPAQGQRPLAAVHQLNASFGAA